MSWTDHYVSGYLSRSAEAIFAIAPERIERMGEILLQAYGRDARVFLAGNGGSASLASHLACDLAKTVSGTEPRRKSKRFRVTSLADNAALVTAWANDEGYDCIFSEQLRNLASPGDVLLVISASGNSPNIIEALRTAGSMGLRRIGWLGFSGGSAVDLVDEYVLIESFDYGIVEGAHGVLSHLLTSWLTQQVAAREGGLDSPTIEERALAV